jgi:glucose-6-phosphate 1-epimerase
MTDAAAIVGMNREHGMPGVASVIEGNGGLPKVRVSGADAEGEIYLHGAHVTSWKPKGAEEVMFVSARSHWEDGKPIRGGIPICFPWFGLKADDPKAPGHGFVRDKSWQLDSIVRSPAGITVSMFTLSDDVSKRWWPADYRLGYRVTFGSELHLELELTNTGLAPLSFEEALHAYYKVGQIEQVRVHGLESVEYLDKTDEGRKKPQQGSIVIGSETDRVYLNTQHAIEVEDRKLNRRIQVKKENSDTTVVWNPWIAKAKRMPDFGENEWPHMLCIEACNVADFAVNLAPGQKHVMKVVTRIL